MLSIDALSAHHTHTKKKSHAHQHILFFYIFCASVFLKRGFLSLLREMQIVNTGLPAAGIRTKAFFEKKYNVALPLFSLLYRAEGIHFQSAAAHHEEKSGTGREFSPAASEFTYSINALGPRVCDWLPAPRNAINV
jgi:hypothetical protein